MKSLEEMREWLKWKLENLMCRLRSDVLTNLQREVLNKDKIMFDAILAALADGCAERTEEKGGVSKEERAEMWQHLDNYLYFHSLKCPICQKIHALIAGNRGEPMTEEEGKELVEYLDSIYFYDELPEIHRKYYEKIRRIILGSRGGAVTEEKKNVLP